MGKLPDLDAFNHEQIVGVQRMGHSISEIVRQIGFSRLTVSKTYQEYMDDGQKLAIGQTAKDSDPLHQFTLFCYPPSNGVFQQDNCSSHKSQLATGWLDEHSSDFCVINWPPRSPDLNLIENL
ncbi:transposable element Tcb2 transposase [Trichonephila clavipes]|nr:transposable element Tcb2 transposase [Trichonephila clavipes]